MTSPALSLADEDSSAVVEPESELPIPYWKQLTPPESPAPRFRHLMVYETDRQKTVLFGGFLESNQYCNETWEFDGRRWRRLDIVSPVADSGYALAYDSRRGMAILAGARNGETWEFDGAKWTRIRCEHRPPMIGGGAMAYDPNRHVTVLFGGEMLPGRDSLLPVLTSELWEYDGNDWTKLDLRGPSPRKYHQMVYDAARERIVLFGGYDGKPLNDTWEMRSSRWHRVETRDVPSPRRGFAMTYDPIHRRTLLFGGFPSGDELWAFDGTDWSRVMGVGSPPYREGAGLVFMPTTRRVLLFGGLSSRLLNDIWEFTCPKPRAVLSLPPVSEEEETVLGPLAAPRRRRSPTEQIIPPVLEQPAAGRESALSETTTPAAVARRPTSATTGAVSAKMPAAVPKLPVPSDLKQSSATTPTLPASLAALADLSFDNVTISTSTLRPKQPFSLRGWVVNSGKRDADCWIEVWLLPDRANFVRVRLLCSSLKAQIKAAQSFSLSQWKPVCHADIPAGQYYIALEIDRSNEVQEQNEANNIYVMASPIAVLPPE